jgi:hypothetical protein
MLSIVRWSSAADAKEPSPPRKRWVGVRKMTEPQRGDTHFLNVG